MNRFIILHAFIPVFIGGLLYIGYRSETLIMFDWFDAAGLTPVTEFIRAFMAPAKTTLPKWIFLSLPDGLWLYSFMILLGSVWRQQAPAEKYFFTAMAPIIGIGEEVGQFFGLVPGTFDYMDLFFMAIATLFAGYYLSKKGRFLDEQA